jgi:hypothetical protein
MDLIRAKILLASSYDVTLMHMVQMAALQLVEWLAAASTGAATQMQQATSAAALCQIITSHSLLDSASPDTCVDTSAEDTTLTPVQPSALRRMPHFSEVLAALRCLRLLTSAPPTEGGPPVGTFPLLLLRSGLYPAITRLLIHATALAVPLQGFHGTGRSMSAAGVTDPSAAPACPYKSQADARKMLLERLPLQLRGTDSYLGVVMQELAMWIGIGGVAVGDAGGWKVRGDVVTHLCSAVLDTFAYDDKACVLEQPPENWTAKHWCAAYC